MGSGVKKGAGSTLKELRNLYSDMTLSYLVILLVLGLVGAQNVGLEGDTVSIINRQALVEVETQLEAEIVKLGQETRINRRYNNMRKYEKIFLRIASMGALAVSRNVQYAEINAVYQDDDDEEEQGIT